nr:MAG TPA: hypothetical protein [Bacteriophage sp.]
MNDIKQKINRAHELLSSVQIAGAYAKLFGAAMQEIENAYAGVEKAERELITLRNRLAESEKKAGETDAAKAPAESEVTDG